VRACPVSWLLRDGFARARVGGQGVK